MQRKIHNQTLFVAALSVYLGLLIVGAPPQVLAQTKFVGNKNTVQTLGGQNLYGDALNNLVVELNKLAKKGKYDWNLETSSKYESFSICESDDSPAFEASTRNVEKNKQLMLLLDGSAEKIVRNFLKIEAVFLEQPNWRGIFELSIKSDKSGLTVEIKPDQYRNVEADFVGAYTQFFEQEKTVWQNQPIGVIYKNTVVLGEKSNFLIVTRLPRAGLDALLKANEKAN